MRAHLPKDSVEFGVVREAIYNEWFPGQQKREGRAHVVQRMRQVGAPGSASRRIGDAEDKVDKWNETEQREMGAGSGNKLVVYIVSDGDDEIMDRTGLENRAAQPDGGSAGGVAPVMNIESAGNTPWHSDGDASPRGKSAIPMEEESSDSNRTVQTDDSIPPRTDGPAR